MNAKNITKQDVINELRRLQAEGHSMKINEFERWLQYEIKKYFGGWKQAKAELGIVSAKRKPGGGPKPKWTTDVIIEILTECHRSGYTSKDVYAKHKQMCDALQRKYGGLNNACDTLGIPRFKRAEVNKRPSKWTKSRIDSEIKNLHEQQINVSSNNLRSKGYGGLLSAAKRVYGSWNNALKANGIEPVMELYRFKSKEEVAEKYRQDKLKGVGYYDIDYHSYIDKFFGGVTNIEKYLGIYEEPYEYKLLKKSEIDEKVYDIINKEHERINTKILDKYDKNIVYSIRKHYGNITDYFSQLDVDYYAKPYVPFRWDAENVKRQLMRWIREGKPVNYTYVAMKHNGIIVAARKFYGGWAELFEACGLNYDDYRTDTDMASFYGKQLEDIFAEILDTLHIKYEREPHIDNCRPDFVIGNEWIDVKLSEWTIHISDCDTLKKYEPHCETLTIVFLRGNKQLNKKITDKTRIVNIGFYIDQLPREKRGYFYGLLDKIERQLGEKEVA